MKCQDKSKRSKKCQDKDTNLIDTEKEFACSFDVRLSKCDIIKCYWKELELKRELVNYASIFGTLSNIYDGAFLWKYWIAKSPKSKCPKGSLLRSRILLVNSLLFIVTAL